MWLESLTVANELLEHAERLFYGNRILEIGAKPSLISMVSARRGAQCILATDYGPVPLHILSCQTIELYSLCASAAIEPRAYQQFADTTTAHVLVEYHRFFYTVTTVQRSVPV